MGIALFQAVLPTTRIPTKYIFHSWARDQDKQILADQEYQIRVLYLSRHCQVWMNNAESWPRELLEQQLGCGKDVSFKDRVRRAIQRELPELMQGNPTRVIEARIPAGQLIYRLTIDAQCSDYPPATTDDDFCVDKGRWIAILGLVLGDADVFQVEVNADQKALHVMWSGSDFKDVGCEVGTQTPVNRYESRAVLLSTTPPPRISPMVQFDVFAPKALPLQALAEEIECVPRVGDGGNNTKPLMVCHNGFIRTVMSQAGGASMAEETSWVSNEKAGTYALLECVCCQQLGHAIWNCPNVQLIQTIQPHATWAAMSLWLGKLVRSTETMHQPPRDRGACPVRWVPVARGTTGAPGVSESAFEQLDEVLKRNASHGGRVVILPIEKFQECQAAIEQVSHEVLKNRWKGTYDNTMPVAESDASGTWVQVERECGHDRVPTSPIPYLKEDSGTVFMAPLKIIRCRLCSSLGHRATECEMAVVFAERIWPRCVESITEELKVLEPAVDNAQLDKMGDMWPVLWKQFLFLAGVLPAEGYNLVLVPRDETRNKSDLDEVISGDQCFWASIPTALTMFMKAKCAKQAKVSNCWATSFPMEGWSTGGANCRLVHPRGGSNIRTFNEAETKGFAAKLTQWNIRYMLEVSKTDRKSWASLGSAI
jgi:hypothetical protein